MKRSLKHKKKYQSLKNLNSTKQSEFFKLNRRGSVAITSAITGTSRTKLYKELGIESLSFRQWFRRLCTFYKKNTTCA